MSIIDPRASARCLMLGTATVIVAAAILLVPRQTIAGAKDYRFDIAPAPVKSGKATVITVRLVHVPDGKPVSGAVLLQTRFDMGPEGMATMTAPAKGAATSEPGVYQIEVAPSMAGNWGLSLTAKVQDEPETVQGTVTVPVAK